MRKNAYLAAPWLFTVVIAGCANDNPANSPQNTSAMQNVGETPPAATSNNTGDMTGTTAAQPPSTTTGTPTTSGSSSMDSTGGTTSGTNNPGAGASTSTNGSTTSNANASATPLTDDQILEVLHTADVAELEQARLAQSKAQNGRVKKFGAMMIKDHTDADTKVMAIAKNDKLEMSSSPVSSSLANDAQSNTGSLQGQTGASFDKSYIDAQCKEHQALLDLINQTLMPDAKNTDVKDFLTTVRATVVKHLQRAQDIQKSM